MAQVASRSRKRHTRIALAQIQDVSLEDGRGHCHYWVSSKPRRRRPLINHPSAGIIGLNVALVLAEMGYGRSVVVVAEHHPGDTSINYTPPW